MAGAVDATYAYDGAGRRISATVDGVTTDLVLDVRGLGSVLADGSNRFLPGGPSAGHESGGAWLNALANRQGSVLGYADASGLVGTLTHYDPYGSPLPGSAAPAAGPGFTGEWTDATGLVNLRFRAYDPGLQAFLGRDTFGGVASAPLTANRYAYGLGNPLRYTDPSGHFVNEFSRHPGLWSSVFVQSLPFAGDFYSGLTGLWGFDPIAGITLSAADRALAIGSAFMLGGGLHLVGHLDDVADAGRGLDRATEAGRGLDRGADLSHAGSLHSADELGAATLTTSRRVEGSASPRVPAAAKRTSRSVAAGASEPARAVRAGDAGSYADLQARTAVGDALDLHHVPQAAAGFTSRGAGGSIAMPHAVHVLTRTYGIRGVQSLVADAGLSFRQVLARDAWDVRSIAGSNYNQGLRDLIGYYRRNFPELMTRGGGF